MGATASPERNPAHRWTGAPARVLALVACTLAALPLHAGDLARPAGLDDAGWLSLQDAVALAVGEQGKLTAADGAADDNLGLDVALYGDTALVGAPGDDIGANAGQGSAYVFVRVNGHWSLQAKLTASDGAALDGFGAAVAIYADTALIGADGDDIGANANQGSAYVYTRSGRTWTFQAKLTHAAGAAFDTFGASVALSGDTALIGLPSDDLAQPFEIDMGSAQVWVRSAGVWSRQATLLAGSFSNLAPGANFGWSVALSGDTALVGAYRDSIGSVANEAGSAFVFVRNGTTWSGQAKLTASASSANANFGNAVAVYGDTALVGAPRDDIGANILQGSAYFYSRNSSGTWSQFGGKAVQPDGAIEDLFGTSVALSGDLALVGARNDDIGANAYQGSIYVYARGTSQWVQQQRVTASDGGAGDRFGVSAALYGNTALVGAFNDSIGGNNFQGSAYVLAVSDVGMQDEFGYSVALDADTALVGVDFDDIGSNVNQGSAFVFTRLGTGWSLQAQFIAHDGAADDRFGTSVALLGDTALVGALLDDVGANPDQGSAYVFERSGSHWRLVQKLVAADGAAGDSLGKAVALTAGAAFVGAAADDIGSNLDQGSVYAYFGSGDLWTQRARVSAADGAAGDLFGLSVAFKGVTLLVGSNGSDVGGNLNRGAAYVYTWDGNGFNPQAKLTANDGAAGDLLGSAVSLSGEIALVGAPGDAVGANDDQGTARVFIRSGTGWSQQATLVADDGAAGDNFGSSVALSVATAIVGSPGDDVGANGQQGSAYAYASSGGAWLAQGKLVAGDGAAFDDFGHAVAVYADVALVGAIYDDIGAVVDQGSAHVHVRGGGTWGEQAKLSATGVRTEVVFRDGYE